MRKFLATTLFAVVVTGTIAALFHVKSANAQMQHSSAIFTSDGALKLPLGYRKWVFVGAPLTPNGLNDGKAGFPEFHHVYVEASNLDAYQKTGAFPEGTVIVKELTLVLQPTFPDGSRTEPSGRGFFNGEFNGIDVTVKDRKRFRNTTAGVSLPSVITPCHTRQPPWNHPLANAPDAIWQTSPKRT
jgi:hypothetical protein